MQLPQVRDVPALESLVEEVGFLPFFRCGIRGFSLQECTPPGYWFVDGVEGPWEWREAVAAGGRIAYAKLFAGNAGFVSMTWYPHLANYRRDGYDFDTRYEAGLASHKCKTLMDLLAQRGPLLTTELKALAGYGDGGMKGFETVINRLQMQTYITVRSFDYKHDRHGKAYGWGVGRYALSEDVFGAERVTSQYACGPGASLEKMAAHLGSLFPQAQAAQISRLLVYR